MLILLYPIYEDSLDKEINEGTLILDIMELR